MNENQTCLYTYFSSPIGALLLTSDGDVVDGTSPSTGTWEAGRRPTVELQARRRRISRSPGPARVLLCRRAARFRASVAAGGHGFPASGLG